LIAGVNERWCWCRRRKPDRHQDHHPYSSATGAQELNKKEMPLYTNVFSGWLDFIESSSSGLCGRN
jgi:hypothetical protein